MRKRMLSWALVLALCLTLLPASALADETESGAAEPLGDSEPTYVLAEMPGFTVSLEEPAFPSTSLLGVLDSGNSWSNTGMFTGGVYEGYYAQLDATSQGFYNQLKTAFASPKASADITVNYTFKGTGTGEIKTDENNQQYLDITMDSSTQNETSTWLSTNLTTAYLALERDHPEMPWLKATEFGVDNSAISISNTQETPIGSGQYTFDATITSVLFVLTGVPQETSNTAEFESAIAKAKSAVDTARNGDTSQYATVKAIHDHLCNLITYDIYSSSPLNQTAYSGLVSKNTVCAGYGTAFKLLCDQYSIPCIYVTGTGGGGAHGWNYVRMDDAQWYAVDVTWDDQTTTSYDFFLVGSGTVADQSWGSMVGNLPFSQNHAENKQWQTFCTMPYPTLNTTHYEQGGDTEPEEPATITSLTISIATPVKGGTPVTTATVTGVTAGGSAVSGEVTVGSVTWDPADVTFAPDTAYTAAVTLTAPEGYQFTGDTVVTVARASSISTLVNADGTLTVTVTFPATDSETPAPVKGLTRAELAQLLYDKFTPGYTPTEEAPDFGDISGCTEAQQKAIRALAELGYLSGTGGNTFSPTVTVNAAGAATLMARIITGNSSATSDALVTLGILTSSEAADTTTMPDATLTNWLSRFVTRAELAEQLNSETYSWLHNSIHLMTPSLSVQFDDLNVCTEDQKTAIGTLFEKQILSGTGATTFNPTGVVTRAEAAVVLWRAAGSRSNVTPQSLPYTDVKASQWYAAAINCLYAMDVLTADNAPGNEFGLNTVVSDGILTSWLVECNTALGGDDLDEIAPVGGITRAEMAEKVYNDYQTLLEDLPIVSGRKNVAFTDISGCTEAQKAAIEFFYQRGIISGTDPTGGTTFTPYAAASNAQIAVFLHRCATAANSGSSTDTVTETAGDGALQASLLHDSGEWYADAVDFLIQQGAFSGTITFANPNAPGIGTEMINWNDGLKPTPPTISCTNGTVTITGKVGEPDVTIYYTMDGSDPTTADTKYTGPFTVTGTAETTVKAVAVRNNMVSAVVSETCQPAPSELTVELSETSFTYSGSSQMPTVTVKLGEATLTENTHYTVSYSNSNGGTGNTTNAGTVTVTVTGTDTGSYAGKTGTATYTIAPAELTIKAKDQTITYGGSIVQDVAQCMVSGLCSPDTLTSVTLTASTTNVTTTGTITPSDAVIKNGDTDVTANYDISYVSGTLTILKATPTITFQDYAPGKTYNGAPLAVPTADQLTITGGGIYDNVKFTWYEGTSPSGTKLDSAPKDAGTYYVVASIAETANTTAATATSGSITISKRAITVTPNSGQSKVYGTADPLLTYKVSGAGLVDGETLIGALSRDAGTDVDTYKITQGTLTNDVNPNYTITFVSGETFAITQAPQAALTITGQPDTVTYGDSSFTLTATGGSGTGAVTWAVPAGTVASVDSGTGAVTISGVGELTITATKAGDGNYKDASASWTFTVQKKPVTATVTAQDKTYDGNPTATVTATVAETDLVGNDSITITGLTGTFADANVGEDKTVTVNASHAQVTGDNSGCYEITYPATTTATISKDTSATAPAKGEGYTLDYAAETITVTSGYEVSTAAAETGTTVPSGSISAYLGQTLYIRKAEDANHTASGWTAFTLAARPGAPTVSNSDETVLGKDDGAVTGITAAMEYQINGGAWTDGSGDLTNLAAGTVVTVRVKATSSAPHGEETTRTIAAGPAITVTFDSQGGSSVDGVTGLSYGSKVTKPADPARENYEFLGWYEDDAGTTPWDFGTDTVTENTTLYAKWKQVKFRVSVEVKEHNETTPINEATVTLMQGNKTIDTGKTGTDGKFTFGRYIPAGAYNIVTAYTPSGGGEQTKTSLVVIADKDETVSVIMPSPGVNSVLTVTGDDTPAVVVGGLDEEAEALKTGEVTKVTVSMKVEEQSAAEADGTNQIQQTAGASTTLQYLEIAITKTLVTSGEPETSGVNETTTVLEIVVPFDFIGKDTVTVYRYHDGKADALMTAAGDTKTDGTYQLDTVNGLIHIFARKFSTYAIGYTTDDEEPVTPPVTPVDPVIPSTPSTGGSEPDGDYTVTVDRTTGGKVTVNPGRADKGDTVTITATPDAGYVVDEVTVNGVTNGVKYLGDNKYSFTMPGSSAKISVTFVKDGTQTGFPFTDVSESFWARTEIEWAYENGYVNGTSATGFNPNGTISRQQVWMILARIAGENPATMAEAKAWAIANGVSDGSNPGGSVTRQQLVTILYRFAGQNGYDTTARADLSGYPDVTTVASYATEAMAWAVAEGIIGGTTQGTLNPAGTASRAQFAVILYRYMA